MGSRIGEVYVFGGGGGLTAGGGGGTSSQPYQDVWSKYVGILIPFQPEVLHF